jgi:DNA-binding transcriptional ArsR family regulator
MSEPRNQPEPQLPRHEIRDPQVLRAMAHPLRQRLMRELIKLGHATATELSERTGESAANCSWHLRQLAKYGFIEEVEGRSGRQRPWRPVVGSVTISPDASREPELVVADQALTEVMLQQEVDAFRVWQAERYHAPLEWQQASTFSQSWNYLTADELAQFTQELQGLILRWSSAHIDRRDPAHRPDGARPVRVVSWVYPADRQGIDRAQTPTAAPETD